MAGELRFTRYLSIIRDGALQIAHGTIEAAKSVLSINAQRISQVDFTIAASSTQTVWTWSAATDAKFILIESDGLLSVSLKVQKPTSGSDKTPTGTPLYPKLSVNAGAPLILDMNAIFNSSATNYNASHFGGSGPEDGYIYEIAVKNPSSTSSRALTVVTTD